MRNRSFDAWPCSAARAINVLGDPWSLLILRDVYHGLRRFDELQSSLNIARNTLTDRLKILVDAGMLERRHYMTKPERHEYVATEMGSDFFGSLAAIVAFGDKWLSNGEGDPVTLHHLSCGHDSHARVVCSHCGDDVNQSNIEFRVGPGFPDDLPAELDNRSRFAPPTRKSG